MRLLTFLISFVVLSSLLQAETHKYSVEEFLHVTFEGKEASETLRAFDLPMEEGSSGKGKLFKTSKNSVELYCFKRHYNVEPYACHFTFDLRGLANDVTLKTESKGMRFVFNNQSDSDALYNALLVPDYILEGKIVKVLEIDNGEVVIDCRLDSRRENAKPSCSILANL
jgi:hypothetical protein